MEGISQSSHLTLLEKLLDEHLFNPRNQKQATPQLYEHPYLQDKEFLLSSPQQPRQAALSFLDCLIPFKVAEKKE